MARRAVRSWLLDNSPHEIQRYDQFDERQALLAERPQWQLVRDRQRSLASALPRNIACVAHAVGWTAFGFIVVVIGLHLIHHIIQILDLCMEGYPKDALDFQSIANIPSAPPRETWSSGSAFSAIFLLQLSCVFQPAGSAILEGANNCWRFSPLYCCLDILVTVRHLWYGCMSAGFPLKDCCQAICAARYRSYRPLDWSALQPHERDRIMSMDPIGLATRPNPSVVLQDIEDVSRTYRGRRLLTFFMSILVIVQFTKIVSISGNKFFITTNRVLAIIYFSYWLIHEVIAGVIRHSGESKFKGIGTPGIVNLSLAIRPQWSFTIFISPRGTLYGPTHSASLSFIGGLIHFGSTIALGLLLFRVGLSANLETSGARVVDLALTFWLLVAPILTIFVCVGPVIFFLEGVDKRSKFVHLFYTVQGMHVCTICFLFYMSIYDSKQTSKPSWIDWLGKI